MRVPLVPSVMLWLHEVPLVATAVQLAPLFIESCRVSSEASAVSRLPPRVCAAALVTKSLPLKPLSTLKLRLLVLTGATRSSVKLSAVDAWPTLPATSVRRAVNDLAPSVPRSLVLTVKPTVPRDTSWLVSVIFWGALRAFPFSKSSSTSPGWAKMPRAGKLTVSVVVLRLSDTFR